MRYTLILASIKKCNLFLFLTLALLILPDLSTAQGKSRKKATSEKFFTIQGGAYYELGDVQAVERTINVNHFNVLKFGIGTMKFKSNKISQLNLEASFFRNDFGVIYFEDVIVRGFELTKIFIEAEYFKSVLSRDQIQDNFHLGYLLNINYSRDDALPFATNAFQRTQTCICAGVGLKAMYAISISDKLLLTIGSDVNLLDSGLLIDYNASPNIISSQQSSISFNSSLWRPRIGIDIGLAF